MKKNVKRVLSVILTIALLLTSVPLAFATGSNEPLTVNVTTTKPEYVKYEPAEITVTVTNTSEENVNRISAEAVFTQLAPCGKNSELTKEAETLKPGESFSFTYQAMMNEKEYSIKWYEKIAVWFIRVLHGCRKTSDNSFNDGRECITDVSSVKFGNFYAENTVKVWYEEQIENLEFGYLYTNPSSCEVGKKQDITFFIEVASSRNIENLELYVDDNLIGTLNNDGKNGDISSDDNIYSGTFSMFSNERKYVKYYVKYKDKKSSNSNFLFSKAWTAQEEAIIKDFYNDIAEIKSKYTITKEQYDNHNSNALLRAEQCYNEIIAYLDTRSDIMEYDFTGFNIMVMFDFAIPVGIPFDDLVINENNYSHLSVNSRTSNSISSNTSAYKSKVITLQPYYNDMNTTSFDDAAINIESNTNYTFADNVDNQAVTIETMRTLSKYGVIIVDSHGGNWNNYGYVMSLSEEVTAEKNAQYEQDRTEGRIIPNGSHYVITQKFFNDYYSDKDFDNSIIYLGTCNGGDDNVQISNILRSKGAEAVMAYKNTVITKYDCEMITTISERLAKGDTVQEAVKEAKRKHGDHDPYISGDVYNDLGFWDKLWYNLGYFKSANPAELILSGNNTSFKLSDNPISEQITGQVIDSINNKPIPNVKVSCDKLNVNCVTDMNGIFKFNTALPLQQATFAFSHDDYKDIRITVTANSYSMLDTVHMTKKVKFAGGDGTAENPYQVSTPEQLNEIDNHLDKHFIQINDIDMSSWGNWDPIGNAISIYGTGGYDKPEYEDNYFKGSYNGNNYTISNLTIDDSSVSVKTDCFGLFAGLEGATVKNLALENISYNIDKNSTNYDKLVADDGFTYSLSVGGITGRVSYTNSAATEITNCHVSGSIHVTGCCNAYIGGICGIGHNINNCTNSADISVNATYYDYGDLGGSGSTVYCGGINGNNTTVTSNINKCNNYGNIIVSADQSAGHCGGISGYDGNIDKCKNYGNIICNTYTGGVGFGGYIGGIVGTTDGYYVSNCINYGNVNLRTNIITGTPETYAGGIAGRSYFANTDFINCYNYGNNIIAYTTWIGNESILEESGIISRIAYTDRVYDCYSINSTLLNGETPTENISPSDSNGGSLTKEEMDERVKDLFKDQ